MQINPYQKLDALKNITRTYNNKQVVTFLIGYALGEMKSNLLQSSVLKIHDEILNIDNLIRQKILQRRHSVELIVQSLERTKGQSNFPLRIKKFSEILEYNIQQLAMNNNYLINKWNNQQNKYAEDESSKHLIEILLEQQQRLKKLNSEQNKKNEELAKMYELQQKQKYLKDKQQKQKFQIECQICIVEIDLQDIGTLQCGHMFHRECLYGYIKNAISSNRLQISCPMQQCNINLTYYDVKQFLDQQTAEKFDKFWFNKYVQLNSKNTSWCPTPGCSAAFTFDEAIDQYQCVSCKRHYCLKCKCDYHYGQTCAQYRINNSYGEADKKFEEFVLGAKYKKCPQCNFWVERASGCSTMTCRCGHQFCYDCGGSDCPHGACKHINMPPPPPPPVRRPMPILPKKHNKKR